MDNDELALVWKALSDPTRRTILDLLRERPRTTGELCNDFKTSRFAVMKHLSILEQAELIVVRRQGRERWNYLNAIPLQRIYERWLLPYEATWASALLQLKRQVEGSKGQTKMSHKALTPSTLKEIRIEQNINIKASAERVFAALTEEMPSWWGLPYRQTAGATQTVLEPYLGGRLYEDMGEGQGLLLATVTFIRRPVELRLVGPMHVTGLAQGVLSFQLEAQKGGTLLKFSHRMIGSETDITEQIQSAYETGWQELLGNRLKNFVEQGIQI